MKKLVFIFFLIGITLLGFAQSVQLVKPTAGDIWKAFTIQKIQWTSNNIANIKLESSLDSGRTWSVIVASYPATASFYDWAVPYKPSDSCYIRISDVLVPPDPGTVYNNAFKIPSAGLSLDSLPTIAYAKTVMPITWISGGIQRINIYVSYDSGVNYRKIADTITTNNFYYSWVVSDSLSNKCLIKIKSAGLDSTTVISSTAFQIRSLLQGTTNKYTGGAYDGHSSANNMAGKVLLTVLTSNDSLAGNSSYTIRWQQNNVNLVNLFYSPDNGTSWQSIVNKVSALALSYPWTIPNTPTNFGKLKIVNAEDSTLFNICTGYLVIKSKSLKIVSPDSSMNVFQNTVLPIGWTSSGVTKVIIKLLSNNSQKNLADSVAALNEIFNWVIPTNTSDSFRILIIDKSDSTLRDTSVLIRLKTLPVATIAKYRGGGFDGHAVAGSIAPKVKLLYPLGGEILSVYTNYTITWSATNFDRIRLDVSLDSGRTWSLIADSIPASAPSYVWKSPVTPSTICLIRIRNSSDSTLFNICASVFILKPKSITNITDTVNWIRGTAKSIEWQSGGIDSIRISYKTSLLGNWIIINKAVSAVSNIQNWVIPLTIADSVWIRMIDITDSTVKDERGFWGNMQRLIQSFSPVKYQGGSFDGHALSVGELTRKIFITNPFANEILAAGNSYTIKWTTLNLADSVFLQFSIDGGINWSNIKTVSSLANSYQWLIPKKYPGSPAGDSVINSNQCQVRALALPYTNNILLGASDRTFSISSLYPVIYSINPTTGTSGDTVIIKGNRFTNSNIVKLGSDTVSKFTIFNDSTIQAIVGNGASGSVYIKNNVGFNADTAIQFLFIALKKPAIISFTPSKGITGTAIQIKGVGFKKVNAIFIGGAAVTSYTIASDTVITGIVGSGNTGKIVVRNATGSDTSLTAFTYYAKPIVSSFSPTAGTLGTWVQIKGKGFNGASAVNFGGVLSDSITVVNDSIINARLGTGNTGNVKVSNPVVNDSSQSIFTYLRKPIIQSFTPNSGITGTSVRITGTKFTGVSSVFIGGVAATAFTIASDSVITAIVANGNTGKIVINNLAGYDTSLIGFTYYPKPIVSSFSPTIGTLGTWVQIKGKRFSGANAVNFGGVLSDSITVVNDSIINARLGAGSTGKIRVSNLLNNDSSTSIFTYVIKPTVTSIVPSTASTGSSVRISGTHLSGVSSVKLGIDTVSSFVVASDTIINAIVGNGATGSVSVSNLAGTNTGVVVKFTFVTTKKLLSPILTSFNPIIGTKGTSIQIKGSKFIGVTSVSIGGVAVSSLLVISDSIITAAVGSGNTGKIVAINAAGDDTSLTSFTYYPKPIVSSFSPTTGTLGTWVQIKGMGFNGASAVNFGGVLSDSVTVVNDSIINARLGIGNTGNVKVSNPVVNDSSQSIFTYLRKPIIQSFTPNSGITGTIVRITGTKFTGVSSVFIGAVAASAFTIASDSVITAIVANGNTGKIVINNLVGYDTSLIGFTYYPKPIVSSFSPTTGTLGTWVQIKGKGFSGASAVNFGGVLSDSITVVNDSIINARLGIGNTGNVKVSNPVVNDSSQSIFTYLRKPIIQSFTPNSGITGTSVRITGTKFTGVSSVTIGGVAASAFTIASDSVITAIVANGNTGKIVINNLAGYDTSLIGFTYYPKPIVSSFSPTTGTLGTWVQIKGKGFSGANTVNFGGVLSDSITVVNDSIINARLGIGNTGNVKVSNPVLSDSSQSIFTYLRKPIIQSFTPNIGFTGTSISITGNKFTGVSSVFIGGVAASAFSVTADSLITAVVGNGNTGKIVVNNLAGPDTSIIGFTYFPKPLISSFSPISGGIGTWVQIKGKAFSGVNAVSFGGVLSDSLIVLNDSIINARLGIGGTGSIRVTNPVLSESSQNLFTYLYKPSITSFTPTNGSSGTTVTISGTHFSGVSSVLVGSVNTNFSVVNDSTITVVIGSGSSGIITVTNSNGSNISSSFFTYFSPPIINSFTPTLGTVGTIVKISGSGFLGSNAVSFGGTTAISFKVDNDSLITATVGAGTTGNITIVNIKGTANSSSTFTYNVIVLTPVITSFTPSSTLVGGLITIIGKNLFLPKTITIGSAPAVVVSNNGDTLVAMVMPGSGSGTISIITENGNTQSSNQFTILTSSYPLSQQGSKLVGSSNLGFSQQGSSVAISADGNTAVVGGMGDNNNQGAAWVYTRNANNWQQVAKLIANDNSGAANIGGAVSISADGKTVIIGGEKDDNNLGAAWVFINTRNNTWVQQGIKLVSSGLVGSQSYFGYSVSLSIDGNTAVIGARGDNNNQGAVFIFIRNGSSWVQQGAKLVGNGNVGPASQGSSVSITADGNTVISGGEADNNLIGAAWVFIRKNNSWAQQGSKLSGNDNVGAAKQGTAVSISADGKTAVIGGSADNSSKGAAWVFIQKDSVWTQQGSKLTGKGQLGVSMQGSSLALSADGNLVVIGGEGDNNNIGSTTLFRRINGNWKQQGMKLSGNDALGSALQGYSVALSADGNTCLIGGDADNNGIGASWVFVPANIWSGKLSTDWNATANWSNNSVPQNTDVVVIPQTANQPIINNTVRIGKLILDSATSLTLNGSIEVGGGISNNGSVLGAGSLTLIGTALQQFIGKGVINNLVLTDSSKVSVDADTTSITGSILPNSGVIYANGNLRLISNLNGTARIGVGTSNYLNGNIIVQRYIDTMPEWRMIGFPFKDSTKLKASQLKGFFPYGYAAYSYNEPSITNGNISTGWAPYTSGMIGSNNGILINGGIQNNTMQLTGPINMGTVQMPLSYTISNLNNGWNLISNPFASNINWNTIILNNSSGLQNAIYRYDPHTRGYASYVNGNSVGNLNNIIESGSGFFVRSIGATSLRVSESDKTIIGPVISLMGFGTDPTVFVSKSIVKLGLIKQGESNGDEVLVRWGVDPATDNFDDKYDAYDLGRNSLQDLSVIGDDKIAYSIFHGSALLFKEKEIRKIALRIRNMSPGTYLFHSYLLSPMFANNELYLIDNYTRKNSLISKDSASYAFSITNDSLSFSNNRFNLAFNYKSANNLPISVVEVKGIQLLNNPSSDNQFKILFGADYKRVEWQLVDNKGRHIQVGTFYDVVSGKANIGQSNNVSAGVYFIKLVGDGQLLTTQKWIKQ